METRTLEQHEYQAIMEAWLDAWNRSDPQGVASFYHERCDYRDPTVPNGISSPAKMARYLRILFRHWPIQEWKDTTVYKHAKPSAFSVCCTFRFANDTKEVKGTGMDLIEFEGDKVSKNYVFLNAEKWPEWIEKDMS
jgi:hypothetical protein